VRYYVRKGAVLVRGIAFAAGTGLPPGGRGCTSVLMTPPSASCPTMPAVPLAAMRNGLAPSATCGLVTESDVRGTVVAQYDSATAFALADGEEVALIAWTRSRIDSADTGALIEAVTAACPVRPAGLLITSDGVDGEVGLGPLRAAASAAVLEALSRRGAAVDGPAFLIYSRFGGGHWVAWSSEGCPYYPCHRMDGQRCEFCYCPLYPCGDESLGEMVPSTTIGMIWNCSSCTLLHRPAVADHLLENPMASLPELKRVARRRGADA